HLYPPSFPTRRSSDLSTISKRKTSVKFFHRGFPQIIPDGSLSIEANLTVAAFNIHATSTAVAHFTFYLPKLVFADAIAGKTGFRDRKSTRLNSSHVKI